MKPEEELISSAAEADKSSAAEAAVGLDEAFVMAAIMIVSVYYVCHLLRNVHHGLWCVDELVEI